MHLPDPALKAPPVRARWLSLLYRERWVLYAKRPFGGPQQVLRYLANYTHRVALSNRRISLHILPAGLVRIRHYGILGNNRRKRDLEAVRAMLKRRGCVVELFPRRVWWT